MPIAENNKDLVAAFAFGSPDTLRQNQRIARDAWEKAIELKCALYKQDDIYIPHEDIETISTEEDVYAPPKTLAMARHLVGVAKTRGIKKIWVAAAAPHLWRCKRDTRCSAKEIGLPIEVHSCAMAPKSRQYWFNPKSTQIRTRSVVYWYIREIILRCTPFFIYELFAR